MSNDTVDVIIPTYNGMAFLPETLDSALAQSYKNILIYVVDDGSNDSGATERYVKSIKDPRVKYLKKKNAGPSAARNFGIAHSSSPYIAFLDSDDVWHPDKLKRQLALLKSNNRLGLVYGLCKIVNEQGKFVRRVPFKARGKLFRYLLSGNKISGSASMVVTKRSIIEEVGGFKEQFWNGEDWEMWLRIAKKYEIDYVPSYLVNVRSHPAGAQANSQRMAEGLENIINEIIDEFKLGPRDRAILVGSTLKELLLKYFQGGDKVAARRIMMQSLKQNPLALRTHSRHVLFIYLRILLGNEGLRSVRRKLSPRYRRREKEFLREQANKAKK